LASALRIDAWGSEQTISRSRQTMTFFQENDVNTYQHHISGFFADRDEALATLTALIDRGLPPERVHIYDSDAVPVPAPRADSNAVLKDVLVDGSIGTVVGTGIGALGEVALVAANVSLFIASPLIAPLVMLGWGASIGGLLGAAFGATASAAPISPAKDGWLSTLVRDAISKGQIVLVVDARSAQETVIARDIIRASVGDVKESTAISSA
jgi:hypothetical protein